MAEDSRTFQEFLLEQRKTNEQLSSLRQENKLMSEILADLRRDAKEDSTMEAYIQSALPEIISDTKNTKKQLDLDKSQRLEEIKEGAFDVDDILKEEKEIFENITKILTDTQVILQAIFALNTNQFNYEKLQDFRQKREQLASGEPITSIPKQKEEEKEETASSFLGGLTGALSGAGLGALALGLGKSLLKGGFYGGLGILLGDQLSKYIDDPFFKETLQKGLPATAIGLGLGGVPGAFVGLASTGIGGVINFIAGKTEEISTYDFASATLGTTGALYFANSKVRNLLKAGKGGIPVKLGAALLSTPVLIAGGIGIAVGIGARFLANKMDEYQDKTLEQAKSITKKIDEDLGKSFAENETKLLEKLGFSFGQQESETGTLRQATTEALEDFRKEGELSEDAINTMSDTVGSLSKITNENLETILQDSTKTKNLITTLQNLTYLATEGQLENTEESLSMLLSLQNRVSDVATELEAEDKLAFVNKGFKVTDDILSQINETQGDIEASQKKINDYNKQLQDVTLTDTDRRIIEDNLTEEQRILDELNESLKSLSITRKSLGTGISLDVIKEILGEDYLKDLIRREVNQGIEMIDYNNDVVIKSDNDMNNLKLTNYDIDAMIKSNDQTNKFLIDTMNKNMDLASELDFMLRNPSGGQVNLIGGNTAINSSANTISLSKRTQPEDHTYNIVSISN